MSNIKNIKDNSQELLEKLGEVGIDSLIKNDILKEMPLLGTITSVFKLSNSIADHLLLAKIKEFIENLGDVSEEKRNQFNEKTKDAKEFSKISRMLLHYLNNFNSEKKASVLGFVFTVYLNNEISESTFRKFANLVDKVNFDDLKRFVSDDGKFDWLYAHDYIANGLAMFEVPQMKTWADFAQDNDVDQTGMSYGANPWGAEIIRILKPFFDNE